MEINTTFSFVDILEPHSQNISMKAIGKFVLSYVEEYFNNELYETLAMLYNFMNYQFL